MPAVAMSAMAWAAAKSVRSAELGPEQIEGADDFLAESQWQGVDRGPCSFWSWNNSRAPVRSLDEAMTWRVPPKSASRRPASAASRNSDARRVSRWRESTRSKSVTNVLAISAKIRTTLLSRRSVSVTDETCIRERPDQQSLLLLHSGQSGGLVVVVGARQVGNLDGHFDDAVLSLVGHDVNHRRVDDEPAEEQQPDKDGEDDS